MEKDDTTRGEDDLLLVVKQCLCGGSGVMCYGTMRLSISLMRTSWKQGTRVITTLAEPVSNKDVSLLVPGFGLTTSRDDR
jgi:hypothetical protein